MIEKIIQKYLADREVIKTLKAKHTEELRVLEEFQAKRENALLEMVQDFDMETFAFFTDLYVNGRDGKADVKKTEANISLAQNKIEAWLLKMLGKEGKGVVTNFGTVYKTRKESVTVGDFETFIDVNMLAPAAAKVAAEMGYENEPAMTERVLRLIHENMHLEYLTKAVRKESALEAMGEADPKTGSRPNSPMAGLNYVAIQAVGVRKAK